MTRSARGRAPARAFLGSALLLLAAWLPPGATPPADEARLRAAARLRGQALAAMDDGDYAGAAARLEELAELLPDNVLPPLNLAICRFHLGDPEGAREAAERARTLAPDNPQVLFALGRILAEAGEEELWRRTVDHFAAVHPTDPRPHYLRGRVLSDRSRHGEALTAFREAVARQRDNLVLLAEQLVAAAAAGEAEATADALDAVEDRLNGFDPPLASHADHLRRLADRGETDGLHPAAQVLRNILRPTDLYAQGLRAVAGDRGPHTGMFPQLDFDPPLPAAIQGGQDIEIAFAEVAAGTVPAARSLSPLARAGDAVERDELWSAGPGGVVRVAWKDGALAAGSPVAAPAGALLAHDLDGDGIGDLAVAARGIELLTGLPGGDFAPAAQILSPERAGTVLALHALEVDHDGDLDLLVARAGAPDLYLQNNGDGTWSERAGELGLGGPATGSTAAVSADFDDDGDLDLLVLHRGERPRIYRNDRREPLAEVGAAWGLAGFVGATEAAAADFDLDGRMDLALAGAGGTTVLANRGDGFEAVDLPPGLEAPDAALVAADFDNDGDPDLALVGVDGEVLLLRNRRGSWTVEPQPIDGAGVGQLLAADVDGDGDLDLAASGPTGLRLWRNEGGDRNQWLRVKLVGLADNSSKTNTDGLFARVETRSAGHYQMTIGNGAVVHLGLGAHREADVLRVVWTNGVAQTWARVAAGQTLVEQQVLKGSCPFLYTWDGAGFRFATDLLWESPLGMVLADGSPAPHQAARDFVLVPGEALQPAGDELWLQITEELWETAYVDRHRLLAVDHPAASELVVDEAFTRPPHATEAPLHWVGRSLTPSSATDHRGRDVLRELARRDETYVGGLPLDRYQGLTRGHWIDLVFEGVPAGERLRLLLAGWIFPTDASINFALAQDGRRDPQPPVLSLRRPDGGWEELSVEVGFPNGKRKAVVVELTDLLPAGRVELRLATSLQIYWDAARLAIGEPPVENRITALEPVAADLHYRGYSRLYRDGPSGPHLFDYSTVSVEARFRDMRGRFTRYGEVGELLLAADDRYVVMNAGDELTVRFDATRLPPLPPGWVRDWVVHTEGWVKDADIHTIHSQTVAPLPYHGMVSYPDRPVHRYPDDAALRDYLERYQTRAVDDRPFREALKRP